jgi:serine phosphatase RsbU (regulator of sigma subunit)
MFIFVVLVVLYLRYRDEQARQAAAEQNLAAARRMQEQLLASSAESPAGFEVTAVYRPAQEVGGDFYRTELLEDGSLLVVVGDVSGKGLDAALLVAAVLGGLAIEKEKRPGVLLADLNRAVAGRTAGGFITACCARFYPDGRAVIANAGHISPYLAGQEIVLDNGLPLGISVEAGYGETAIQATGTLTFLSDGVAEARNAKGELLGFERMAALTTRSAAEIANAALHWGQEDDITVLTVKRLAVL